MPRHEPAECVGDMIEHATAALDFYSDGLRDRKTQFAIVRALEVIGEAANRLERTFQDLHPSIPWSSIIGFRNRVVHGYDAIDLDVVRAIVEGELAGLIEGLEAILANL